MPEFPEVNVVIKKLELRTLGKTIKSVDVLREQKTVDYTYYLGSESGKNLKKIIFMMKKRRLLLIVRLIG